MLRLRTWALSRSICGRSINLSVKGHRPCDLQLPTKFWLRCFIQQHQKSCHINHPGLCPNMVSYQKAAIMQIWIKTSARDDDANRKPQLLSKERRRYCNLSKLLFDHPENVLLAEVGKRTAAPARFLKSNWARRKWISLAARELVPKFSCAPTSSY